MSNDNKDTDRQEPEIHCQEIGNRTIGFAWFNSYFPEADEASTEEDEPK